MLATTVKAYSGIKHRESLLTAGPFSGESVSRLVSDNTLQTEEPLFILHVPLTEFYDSRLKSPWLRDEDLTEVSFDYHCLSCCTLFTFIPSQLKNATFSP